ncbi:MAG: DUF4199 domain-containing protein [Paramuribaculum sp.]|nr:DUF4199 domain-containing protein [Paramuribaculum sp.]
MNSNFNRYALQSPLHIGALRGMYLGVWLSIMFMLTMLGDQLPLASLLFLLMALAIPVLVYRWLRSTFVTDGGFTTLSGLWMQGIVMFGGGALVSTTVAVAYFRWVNPHYVIDMVIRMIEIYKDSSMDGAARIATTLQSMVDAGMLPTAQDVALEMFWLTMFGGSVLSLFASLVARARRVSG